MYHKNNIVNLIQIIQHTSTVIYLKCSRINTQTFSIHTALPKSTPRLTSLRCAIRSNSYNEMFNLKFTYHINEESWNNITVNIFGNKMLFWYISKTRKLLLSLQQTTTLKLLINHSHQNDWIATWPPVYHSYNS